MTAAVRCAPPANRPLPAERDNCLPYLERELMLLDAVAGDRLPRRLRRGMRRCARQPRWASRSRDRDRASPTVPPPELGRWTLLGCYHPSQQNTFTGRLTEAMLDEVLFTARKLAGVGVS